MYGGVIWKKELIENGYRGFKFSLNFSFWCISLRSRRNRTFLRSSSFNRWYPRLKKSRYRLNWTSLAPFFLHRKGKCLKYENQRSQSSAEEAAYRYPPQLESLKRQPPMDARISSSTSGVFWERVIDPCKVVWFTKKYPSASKKPESHPFSLIPPGGFSSRGGRCTTTPRFFKKVDSFTRWATRSHWVIRRGRRHWLYTRESR